MVSVGVPTETRLLQQKLPLKPSSGTWLSARPDRSWRSLGLPHAPVSGTVGAHGVTTMPLLRAIFDCRSRPALWFVGELLYRHERRAADARELHQKASARQPRHETSSYRIFAKASESLSMVGLAMGGVPALLSGYFLSHMQEKPTFVLAIFGTSLTIAIVAFAMSWIASARRRREEDLFWFYSFSYSEDQPIPSIDDWRKARRQTKAKERSRGKSCRSA